MIDEPLNGARALPATGTRATLQDILDLERIEVRTFRGRTRPTDLPRVFGGEVAGQALVAAGRTVPADRHVHSLHAYFIRPGDPRQPIMYQVDALRDGRSFTTRRVTGIQDGTPIFHLSASFHIAENGVHHQVPDLRAPDPDDLPPAEQALAGADPRTVEWFARLREHFPVEFRFPEELPRLATARGELRPPRQRVWIRSSERLPDDPLVHLCAATYVSDLFLLAAALPPHGVALDVDGGVQLASLDHAVWFHEPFRADDWLFYEQQGTWAGGGRALCNGSLFDRRGRLVASVIQEGLVRLPRTPAAR